MQWPVIFEYLYEQKRIYFGDFNYKIGEGVHMD